MPSPKYPIYIVSKGRHKTNLTAKALDRMGVDYNIAVEPQEADAYKQSGIKGNIVVLPFRDVGTSVPARNFVWDHSVSEGHEKHWVMDDNIQAFHYLNRNEKPEVETGAIFKAAEDFVDRYENVPLTGFNYYSFCKATDAVPPFIINTRIYSCMLIQNSMRHRWRGKYNEDTDLSLRVLKDGLCTIQFNAFLQGKVTTQRMKGGNMDEFYRHEGTLKKTQTLVEQHPDVVRLVWRFNRWHHHVDYRPFKSTRLIRKSNVDVASGINNYGMVKVDKPVRP